MTELEKFLSTNKLGGKKFWEIVIEIEYDDGSNNRFTSGVRYNLCWSDIEVLQSNISIFEKILENLKNDKPKGIWREYAWAREIGYDKFYGRFPIFLDKNSIGNIYLMGFISDDRYNIKSIKNYKVYGQLMKGVIDK